MLCIHSLGVNGIGGRCCDDGGDDADAGEDELDDALPGQGLHPAPARARHAHAARRRPRPLRGGRQHRRGPAETCASVISFSETSGILHVAMGA